MIIPHLPTNEMKRSTKLPRAWTKPVPIIPPLRRTDQACTTDRNGNRDGEMDGFVSVHTQTFQLWEKVPGAPIKRYLNSSDLDIRTGDMVVGNIDIGGSERETNKLRRMDG